MIFISPPKPFFVIASTAAPTFCPPFFAGKTVTSKLSAPIFSEYLSLIGELSNSGATICMASICCFCSASAIGFLVMLYTYPNAAPTIRVVTVKTTSIFKNVDSVLAMFYDLPETFRFDIHIN